MFGATRYETASNLPTDACSGGWVFHEQVNLMPRTTLRYGVDTSIVRRYVRQRGWHVWYESGGLRPESVEKLPQSPWYEERSPVEPETVSFEEALEYASGSEVVETAAGPGEKWDSLQESDELTADTAVEADLELSLELEPDPEPAPARMRDSSTLRESPPLRETPPVKEAPLRPSPPPEPPLPTRASKNPTRPVEDMRPAAVAPAPARHQVVWFDIPVRDIDRAVRFYSAVLGTTIKKEQAGPGAAIAVLPHSEGAIGGSLVQNMDAKPSDSGPLLYLNTNGRLDEALLAVEKHGGRVLAEKHSIAPFGFRAVVIDSEGNRIALHSM
jgi:predicted enzyme related to lactoylglutathione lyase